jgi:hypothetical protein
LTHVCEFHRTVLPDVGRCPDLDRSFDSVCVRQDRSGVRGIVLRGARADLDARGVVPDVPTFDEPRSE